MRGRPILDLIAAAADAVANSGARRVGVLATTATARSGAYGAAIRARAPDTTVREVAAPELVPLVESGVRSGPRARAAVSAAVVRFDEPLEALVLACTHFPLLDAEFAAVLGAHVRRIDPAERQAENAASFASARGGRGGTGGTRYVTTGPIEPFRAAVASLGAIGPRDVFDGISASLARR